MTELFLSLEQVLSDLLQSGLSTRAPTAAQELEVLAQQYERSGLHNASSMITQLKDALNQRSHMMIKDDMPITALICRLVRYLELCREKLQEEQIEEQWSNYFTEEESI